MLIAAITRRIRSLEEKRAAAGGIVEIGPWLFVCGRSEDEIREVHAAFPGATPAYVPVLWTSADPVPPPCWGDAGSLPDTILVAIASGRKGAEPRQSKGRSEKRTTEMSDDQLMAIIAAPAIDHGVTR